MIMSEAPGTAKLVMSTHVVCCSLSTGRWYILPQRLVNAPNWSSRQPLNWSNIGLQVSWSINQHPVQRSVVPWIDNFSSPSSSLANR